MIGIAWNSTGKGSFKKIYKNFSIGHFVDTVSIEALMSASSIHTVVWWPTCIRLNQSPLGMEPRSWEANVLTASTTPPGRRDSTQFSLIWCQLSVCLEVVSEVMKNGTECLEAVPVLATTVMMKTVIVWFQKHFPGSNSFSKTPKLAQQNLIGFIISRCIARFSSW